MITLNEIAYNIKNIAYGGKSNKEVNISTKQIKHWIHYHRAKLIADNIDKGILSNHIIWQNFPLLATNMYNNIITKGQNHVSLTDAEKKEWEAFPKQGTFPNDKVYGPWTLGGYGLSTGVFNTFPRNSTSLDQYGGYRKKQNKNSFRNISDAHFNIPEPLMLKNYDSIKQIELSRAVWLKEQSVPDLPDDPGDNDAPIAGPTTPSNTTLPDHFGREYPPILLPLKTLDESHYSGYNKFTSNNKAYATLERLKRGERIAAEPGDIYIDNYAGGGLENQNYNTYIPEHMILSLRGLQVSPKNALKGDVLFSYAGNIRMILSDPTAVRHGQYFVSRDDYPTPWNDNRDHYPIPMEYVSDLIQRVVSQEMSTTLKTTADEIEDNMDSTVMGKIMNMQKGGA